MRDRTDATPGVHRLIDQLEYFLGFIGLASLIAGGLGVSTAVSAYIEQRTPSIATLKALGADGALTRDIYLIQVALLAMLGVAIGLVVGAGAPILLGRLAQGQPADPGAVRQVYPWPLAKAGAFGLLAAALFPSRPWPGRGRRRRPPCFATTPRERPPLGVESVGAAIAAACARGPRGGDRADPHRRGGDDRRSRRRLRRSSGRSGSPRRRCRDAIRGATSGTLRMALANLAGPRSAARTAAPAIGLGVALLAAVVLIQSSLLSEVTDVAPRYRAGPGVHRDPRRRRRGLRRRRRPGRSGATLDRPRTTI